MRKFQFRLQVALDQALRLEEQAALALAEAVRERDRQVLHLHDLRALSRRLARELNARQTGEVDVSELQTRRLHLEHTWSCIAEQQFVVQEAEENLVAAREVVVQCMQKREALERLREGHLEEHRRASLALDLKAQDEFTSLKYARLARGESV